MLTHILKEYVIKCPTDFKVALETEIRAWRLARLDVQNTVSCPSSPVARRGLFDGRHEMGFALSRSRRQAYCENCYCSVYLILQIVCHESVSITAILKISSENFKANPYFEVSSLVSVFQVRLKQSVLTSAEERDQRGRMWPLGQL